MARRTGSNTSPVSMTIVNLILQVALGMIIYIGGLFLLKAPIIKQAKSLLKKE